MKVPYEFVNATPPVSDTDIDAQKLNANFDSLSSGGAISDLAITDRHINTNRILPVFFIYRFISSEDLSSRTPIQLGIPNGELVAINDTDQDKVGRLYRVISGQWSLFKASILHISVINKSSGDKYNLIKDENLLVKWSIDLTQTVIPPVPTFDELLNRTTVNLVPYGTGNIDSFVLGDYKTVKWSINMENTDTGEVGFCEILVSNNNGNLTHSKFGNLGNDFDYTMSIDLVSGEIVLSITNNESFILKITTIRIVL